MTHTLHTEIEDVEGVIVVRVAGNDGNETRQTARLIAAAPAMLEALRDCMKSLERMPDVDGAYRVTCIKQAQAIINQIDSISTSEDQ